MPSHSLQILFTVKQNPSGLEIILLDNALSCTEFHKTVPDRVSSVSEPSGRNCGGKSSHGFCAKDLTAKSRLQQLLTALCLSHPYWNDFRLLHFLEKRNIKLSMTKLQKIKEESGLDNRKNICNALIRLYSAGKINLNSHQISFIERMRPEFRDRDLQTEKPGEILVYECLFVRTLKGMGRIYLHTFIDRFNGYLFSKLSQKRSLSEGLKMLTKEIIPLYQTNGSPVQKVLHTTGPQEVLEEQHFTENPEAEWIPTLRSFGMIQEFQQRFLEDFCQCLETLSIPPAQLPSFFDRWLSKHYPHRQFHQPRHWLADQ